MGTGASKSSQKSKFDPKASPSTTFLTPSGDNGCHATGSSQNITASLGRDCVDTLSSGETRSANKFVYTVSETSSAGAASNGRPLTAGGGSNSIGLGATTPFLSSTTQGTSTVAGAMQAATNSTKGSSPPSQRSSILISTTGVNMRQGQSDVDVSSLNNQSVAGMASQGTNGGLGAWRLDANTLFPQLRIRNGISAAAMSLRDMSIGQMHGVEGMATNDIFSERIIWAPPCNYSFTTCGGQSGPIRSISSSADGSQFAVVVAGLKQCFVTDAATGKVTVTIKGHLDPVLSCAQSKDGKFLVTTSADCTVVLWDMTNGKKLREVPVNFQANVCAVSDDSEIVATTSTEDFVHLWDAKQCEPLYTFTRHSATIFSVGFCRKGNLFASGATNGEVMVWSYPGGEVRAAFNKHRSSVLAVSFSHDGRRLCTVDKECVKCWDLFTNHCVFTRDIKGNVVVGPHINDDRRGAQATDETVRFLSCAMIACNLIVVTQSNRFILILDPNFGSEILSIQTKAIATAIGSSFNGDTVFIGDMHGNQYKLKLHFLPRDVKAFNLSAKPFTKEKNAKID